MRPEPPQRRLRAKCVTQREPPKVRERGVRWVRLVEKNDLPPRLRRGGRGQAFRCQSVLVTRHHPCRSRSPLGSVATEAHEQVTVLAFLVPGSPRMRCACVGAQTWRRIQDRVHCPGSAADSLQPQNPVLLLPENETCLDGHAAQNLAPVAADFEEEVVAAGRKPYREGSVGTHAPAGSRARPA